MSELVSLIHKHLDWGFSAYINVDQYVHETSARFRSQWGSAYTFALQMALLGLAQQLDNDRRAGETVNVLIEDGHANAVQAIETLHKMKALNDPWLNLGNYGLAAKSITPFCKVQMLWLLGHASTFATETH